MKRTDLLRATRPLSGPQHYWQLMRQMTDRSGRFSIRDVHGATNGVHIRTIRSYVYRCNRAGLLDIVGEVKSSNNRDANTYRVKVTAADAPFERAYPFADTAGRGRAQLWNAIRVLTFFTVQDLRLHASTDDVQITVRSVRDYVTALRRTGYLIVVEEALASRPATYRLKPGMNSGPKPPALTAKGDVIDRNRREVVGSARPEARS